jgi:hypothetical protein
MDSNIIESNKGIASLNTMESFQYGSKKGGVINHIADILSYREKPFYTDLKSF